MIVPCLEKDSVNICILYKVKGQMAPCEVQMTNYTADMQTPSIWWRKRGSNIFSTIGCESFIRGWRTQKRRVKTSCFCEEYILTSLDSAIQTQAAEDAALIHPCVHREEVWHFSPLVLPSNSKWSKSYV